MRKLLLIAGLAALAVPGLAAAQYDDHPGGLTAREDRLDRAIRDYRDTGQLSEADAHHDRVVLSDIRATQDHMRADHDGLTGDDRADLSRQLDGLDAQLHQQLGDVY